MDQRLVDIETRLAFQERTLLELEEVILRQQREIDQLVNRLEVTEQRLQALAEPQLGDPSQEPPPPHY